MTASMTGNICTSVLKQLSNECKHCRIPSSGDTAALNKQFFGGRRRAVKTTYIEQQTACTYLNAEPEYQSASNWEMAIGNGHVLQGACTQLSQNAALPPICNLLGNFDRSCLL